MDNLNTQYTDEQPLDLSTRQPYQISHHIFEIPIVPYCETSEPNISTTAFSNPDIEAPLWRPYQERRPINGTQKTELSQTESRETESLPNQTSHLSAQTKNIDSKAKRRTPEPAPNPKRKKKIDPLPEGCEDLIIADIVDTKNDEFMDKIKHKPDHVQEELKTMRRKNKNKKSASESRKRKNHNLEKLRTEHEELSQENEIYEELRQKVMDSKDEMEYRVRMIKAEVERLRIVDRELKMEKELEHNCNEPKC